MSFLVTTVINSRLKLFWLFKKMEERQKIRKDIKDSLLTYRNFNKFWVNYKRGVIIYYLVRGPLELYARRDLWQDRFYLISLIAITFNMLIGFILSLIFSSLAITLSFCCSKSSQAKTIGSVHLITMVTTTYSRPQITSC